MRSGRAGRATASQPSSSRRAVGEDDPDLGQVVKLDIEAPELTVQEGEGELGRSSGVGSSRASGKSQTALERRVADRRSGSRLVSRGLWESSERWCEKVQNGAPNGTRTRVSALRGPCPRPLDDGGVDGAPVELEAERRCGVDEVCLRGQRDASLRDGAHGSAWGRPELRCPPLHGSLRQQLKAPEDCLPMKVSTRVLFGTGVAPHIRGGWVWWTQIRTGRRSTPQGGCEWLRSNQNGRSRAVSP